MCISVSCKCPPQKYMGPSKPHISTSICFQTNLTLLFFVQFFPHSLTLSPVTEPNTRLLLFLPCSDTDKKWAPLEKKKRLNYSVVIHDTKVSVNAHSSKQSCIVTTLAKIQHTTHLSQAYNCKYISKSAMPELLLAGDIVSPIILLISDTCLSCPQPISYKESPSITLPYS